MLSANYIRVCLDDLMSSPFGDRPCMHEALFDDRWLKETGVTTLDFAKAMIDEGYHPMTVYFPLVVHGAMLIEPTESESKASLDLFIMTLRDLALCALRRRDGALRRGAASRAAPAARRNARRAPAGAALDEAGAGVERRENGAAAKHACAQLSFTEFDRRPAWRRRRAPHTAVAVAVAAKLEARSMNDFSQARRSARRARRAYPPVWRRLRAGRAGRALTATPLADARADAAPRRCRRRRRQPPRRPARRRRSDSGASTGNRSR